MVCAAREPGIVDPPRLAVKRPHVRSSSRNGIRNPRLWRRVDRGAAFLWRLRQLGNRRSDPARRVVVIEEVITAGQCDRIGKPRSHAL